MRTQLNRTRVRLKGGAILGTVLLLSACAADDGTGGEPGGNGQANAPEERGAAPGDPSDVATDLELPWDFEFLPDGDALVTERDSARILRVTPEGEVSEVGTVQGVDPGTEGGLLGMALPPDFESAPYVYVYFTSGSDNRIVRMPFDDGDLGDPEVLLDGLPKSPVHNGGRIAFGPDGMLYAGGGDAQEAESAQDTDSLAGKILRLTPDGGVPEGNPFGNEVYSYGHRNVQGLAWDDEDRLFGVEFGPDSDDEINMIEAGGNYGWPEVTGTGGGDDYIDPVVVWDPAEASPSGGVIAGGSLWVAALRGERLWQVPLTGDAGDPVGEPREHFVGEYGRLRHVAVTPDGGELWISTSNHDVRGDPGEGDDRILRVPLQD
ncbi:PQQ-dependent sugar dehydrogenase [Allosalinactinospora lopnorensis]|uniref:PQQ-dependent sugar dehydrogenase n=1 Tax=Allosalinactinospora lopnorensis TaxID=1352348 RepID=UPI000623DA4B|nr:PQQ-dependent sugar dehydrogenase [Allosalinactinospora lopnorensis]